MTPSPEPSHLVRPSSAAVDRSSVTPSSIPSARASAKPLDALLTARIDNGDWEITHRVKASDYVDLAIGDLTVRVYRHVRYQCSAPPCAVALNTDDPDTVDLPRPATFQWINGDYVSTDLQRGLGRCDAPDGAVVRGAYDVTITTTLRVTEVGARNGMRLATKLGGDQLRTGAPTKVATAHGCRPWTATFDSSGQRNINPGQATTVQYRNWAGYVVSLEDSRITEVRGSWTQPRIDCRGAPLQLSSFWIGIDGSGNDTLEQLGTEADCRDGSPSYSAWWETIPKPEVRTNLVVRPGDRFTSSIHSEGDRYSMALRNLTTGNGFTKIVDWPRAKGASAEWIAEATSSCPPSGCEIQVLPDFGAVHFTDASAATSSSGFLPPADPTWQLERAVMITKGGRTKADVSALGVGGGTFTVTWRPLP
jgi:hypothetical protein